MLAILMLMSAWVWVAPGEAGAADAAGTYPVTLTFNLKNCASGGNIMIYYYPIKSDGTLDKSNTNLKYTFMNSLVAYSSGDNQTFTAGDIGDNRMSGDSNKSTGNVPGWPYKIAIDTNWKAGNGSADIAIKSIKIGNKTVLYTDTQWSCSNKERDFSSGSTYDGIATTWPEPAITTLTVPNNIEFNVPEANSSNTVTKTTTSIAYDQYGVKLPISTGVSYSFDITQSYPGVQQFDTTVESGVAKLTMTVDWRE